MSGAHGSTSARETVVRIVANCTVTLSPLHAQHIAFGLERNDTHLVTRRGKVRSFRWSRLLRRGACLTRAEFFQSCFWLGKNQLTGQCGVWIRAASPEIFAPTPKVLFECMKLGHGGGHSPLLACAQFFEGSTLAFSQISFSAAQLGAQFLDRSVRAWESAARSAATAPQQGVHADLAGTEQSLGFTQHRCR